MITSADRDLALRIRRAPLRGRGHARAVVAASLLDARARGVGRAVLFTAGAEAEAAYRAIGFEVTGRFGLVLLAPAEP